MKIVQTPSLPWLRAAAATCTARLDISSPFIGHALVEFLSELPDSVTKTILTRRRLVDFASGTSDIHAVLAIAQNGSTVLGLDRLHAKVYVFDENVALVTSANATYSGFHRNAECGLALRDTPLASELASCVRSGFGASPSPTIWNEIQLRSILPAVERLKERIPPRTKVRIVEGEESDEIAISLEEAENLLSSTARWTQLVFRNLFQFGTDEFTTQDVVKVSAQDITREFPANRHPREKIRQQLQVLRDLGLVQFLAPGRYRLGIALKRSR